MQTGDHHLNSFFENYASTSHHNFQKVTDINVRLFL